VKKKRLQQTRARIKEYLALIDFLKKDCEEKFIADPVYRGAILHYLYLMADTCITLASQAVRLHNLRTPQSYHESFDILGEANILEAAFAHSFAGIAGFRNFLAHDYEKIEAQIICSEVLEKLDDVREFLRQIEMTCE